MTRNLLIRDLEAITVDESLIAVSDFFVLQLIIIELVRGQQVMEFLLMFLLIFRVNPLFKVTCAQ